MKSKILWVLLGLFIALLGGYQLRKWLRGLPLIGGIIPNEGAGQTNVPPPPPAAN